MNCCTGKWKKKEILNLYGLSSLPEIEQETTRYKKQEINLLYRDITNSLEKNIQGDFFILKLVPLELRPKLKNFLIYQQKDLDKFFNTRDDYYDFEEIWICRSSQKAASNVYGRLFFNLFGMEIFQSIELSLGGTARRLDQVSLSGGIAYISGRRPSWGWHYDINHLIYNNKFENTMLLNWYRTVAVEIERLRDAFPIFFEDLISLDIASISFDFVAYSSKIVIIDWDTANDNLVIRRLL